MHVNIRPTAGDMSTGNFLHFLIIIASLVVVIAVITLLSICVIGVCFYKHRKKFQQIKGQNQLGNVLI